ncbi:MAG: hydrogenase expression/formation protein HypE [Acidobacteriota bacterium]|nr:hydrogenase expression/formation protein HypE [Acidobacteriota bacterium]
MRNEGASRIELAHGGGGGLGRELIEKEILCRFGDGPLAALPDGAHLPPLARGCVFSTDSFVVQPLVFPGGDIGMLAVHGTVNDIAVSGARPRWLSLAMILEEGLERDLLGRILDSVARAARECGVQVVTGDTKVVARGQCDGLYLNTAGVGEPIEGFDLDPGRLEPGDRVLVSGTLGDHGMAVMAAREGIALAAGPRSDTAPVHRLVEALTPWAGDVKFMRDPTRGGAAAVLAEIVGGRELDVIVEEAALPRSAGAQAVAEILGMDLLQVASEGRVIVICAEARADAALAAMRALAEGRGAAEIGRVVEGRGRVILETAMGGRRLVDVPRGELLPRIC